ncbi:hypothetical protein L2E82_01653 [Cichorium intybus]|uniref:Uncharacterized protein n=1 Tax=Cichorium intybus TaxID=13427 RepID=A0ACB9GZ73_CICIN|nr:hypothetical protein L2E82_01653 [Cichorium intybus]
MLILLALVVEDSILSKSPGSFFKEIELFFTVIVAHPTGLYIAARVFDFEGFTNFEDPTTLLPHLLSSVFGKFHFSIDWGLKLPSSDSLRFHFEYRKSLVCGFFLSASYNRKGKNSKTVVTGTTDLITFSISGLLIDLASTDLGYVFVFTHREYDLPCLDVAFNLRFCDERILQQLQVGLQSLRTRDQEERVSTQVLLKAIADACKVQSSIIFISSLTEDEVSNAVLMQIGGNGEDSE